MLAADGSFMFWKQQLKNVSKKNIDPKKLFISESKRAYNVDEIIRFYLNGSPKVNTKSIGQMIGVLKDFKNTNPNSSININLFTPKDIESLLKFPDFQSTVENDPGFQLKQELSNAIQSDTLALLGHIAQQFAKSDNPGPDIITGPINELYLHLTMSITGFAAEENAIRQKEREALISLTEYDFINKKGLTTYGCKRMKNLISDLNSINRERGACPKEFCHQIANLYCLIVTQRNYHEAKENFEWQKGVSVKAA
jgi:hypothetical protein